MKGRWQKEVEMDLRKGAERAIKDMKERGSGRLVDSREFEPCGVDSQNVDCSATQT